MDLDPIDWFENIYTEPTKENETETKEQKMREE